MLKKILNACVRCKPLHISKNHDTKLNRCLTTFDLTLIGIGSTVGSGIYILTGEVAKNKAGPAVVISFLIAGIASMLSGLCYAELGTRFPKAGSAYVYCYSAIGELCAFFIGWTLILEYNIGVSSAAKALSNYMDVLSNNTISRTFIDTIGEIHTEGFNNYFDLFAAFLVIVSSAVLCFSVKISSRLNIVITTVNIITITIVMIGGFTKMDIKNWSNFTPYGFTGIWRGASTCFYAFIGFDFIATACEETLNPRKSIPLSMFTTISIVCLLYVGVTTSITLMLPYYDLDINATFSSAFMHYHMNDFVYIVTCGAAIALLGILIFSSFPPTRLIYAMATDGLLPRMFAHVSENNNVPVVAIITAGILNALLAAFLDLKSLVNMMSIGTLLAFSIVNISVMILRYRVLTTDFSENNNEEENEKGKSTKDVLSKSQRFITTVILLLVLGTLSATLLANVFPHRLFVLGDPLFIFLFILFLILILICSLFLTSLDGNIDESSFSTPLMPWTALIALAFNFSLMFGLPWLTWIRLIIWSAIGLLIYFGYSMHYSVEAAEMIDGTEYTPLESQSDDILDTFNE